MFVHMHITKIKLFPNTLNISLQNISLDEAGPRKPPVVKSNSRSKVLDKEDEADEQASLARRERRRSEVEEQKEVGLGLIVILSWP